MVGAVWGAMGADGLAICSHVTLKHKAPHRKAWLVERHNAPIRLALQKAEWQVIKKSLCISLITVFGLVTFMHDALIYINNHAPYQALPGRQPALLPPLQGGYHGDLDAQGQNNCARAGEIAAIVSTIPGWGARSTPSGSECAYALFCLFVAPRTA